MNKSIPVTSQVTQKNDHDFDLPLVCLRNHSPDPSTVACRDSSLNDQLIHTRGLDHNCELISSDGEIKQKPNSITVRVTRYQRQSASRKLLPKKAVSKCLRFRLAKDVKVLKSNKHGKCHYGDLVICGRIWDCPVCAAKISERRRSELTTAISQHTTNGGSVILVTLTYPHKREDNLQELLEKQKKASIWFYQHRIYRELKKRYMKIGRVRALEVNYGEANGWHPHIHELWFLELNLHDYQILKSEILGLWVKACERYGLGIPSELHGVDVRGGEYAAKYVSKMGTEDKKHKWGIEDEITKAHAKKGRNGSSSPFQLLDSYIDGDKRSGALFIEYSNAFHGKRQLTWSRGLKSQFELVDKTDDDLAHEQDDKAILLAEISPEQWKVINRTSTPRHDNRVIILTLAENGGIDAMNRFITDLVENYKTSH
jgi:hypothetical protein